MNGGWMDEGINANLEAAQLVKPNDAISPFF